MALVEGDRLLFGAQQGATSGRIIDLELHHLDLRTCVAERRPIGGGQESLKRHLGRRLLIGRVDGRHQGRQGQRCAKHGERERAMAEWFHG